MTIYNKDHKEKLQMESLSNHLNPFMFSLSGGGGLVAKSCPTLAIPQTLACQAPLSMEFSRQEYWYGLPFPSPGELPNSGVKLRSRALQLGS